jgi:hypothetical protein
MDLIKGKLNIGALMKKKEEPRGDISQAQVTPEQQRQLTQPNTRRKIGNWMGTISRRFNLPSADNKHQFDQIPTAM